jgi:hypothetical protein
MWLYQPQGTNQLIVVKSKIKNFTSILHINITLITLHLSIFIHELSADIAPFY